MARVLQLEFFPEDQPQQLNLPIAQDRAGSGSVDIEGGTTINSTISGADICPACGTITLIRAENCRKCLTCGYSEC